jgi:hypothetical protein
MVLCPIITKRNLNQKLKQQFGTGKEIDGLFIEFKLQMSHPYSDVSSSSAVQAV